MSRRQPMEPVEGLKKPTLPPPMARPRTLRPVPPPSQETTEAPVAESVDTTGDAVLASATEPEVPSTAGETAQPKPARSRKPRGEQATTPAALARTRTR